MTAMLFVGGPLHGYRRNVPPDAQFHVAFPQSTPPLMWPITSVKDEPDAFPHVLYRRQVLGRPDDSPVRTWRQVVLVDSRIKGCDVDTFVRDAVMLAWFRAGEPVKT
jgi:hypothetical protein